MTQQDQDGTVGDEDAGGMRAWLQLALTEGIGPVRARDLLAAFGLPSQVLQHTAAELGRVLEPELATRLLGANAVREARVDAALAWWRAGRAVVQDRAVAQGQAGLQTAGVPGQAQGAEAPVGRWLLTLDDPRYPRALLDLNDPPPLLYAVGDLELLQRPAIAVVGSRNASLTGTDTARGFAAALGARGWTIVSGLAEGIDQAAHDGAVDSEGGTIAVLGTGIDRVYPRGALPLAHRIAARGLMLSEQPLGTPPTTAGFPRRNRLIAALAAGTVVIEAAPRSGSLITARQAAELGRDVMAVPGSIHSALARGCNALIRDGASLVETVQHIEAEIRPENRPERVRNQPLAEDEWAQRPRRGAGGRARSGAAGGTAGGGAGGRTRGREGQSGAPRAPAPSQDGSADALSEDALALQDLLGAQTLSSERLANHLQWGIRRVLIGLQQLAVEGRVERLADGSYRAVAQGAAAR